MITWTLVIMVSMGYEFQKNPVALNSTVISGFTTQQACENAKSTIHPQALGFNWTQVNVVSNCVPTGL